MLWLIIQIFNFFFKFFILKKPQLMNEKYFLELKKKNLTKVDEETLIE